MHKVHVDTSPRAASHVHAELPDPRLPDHLFQRGRLSPRTRVGVGRAAPPPSPAPAPAPCVRLAPNPTTTTPPANIPPSRRRVQRDLRRSDKAALSNPTGREAIVDEVRAEDALEAVRGDNLAEAAEEGGRDAGLAGEGGERVVVAGGDEVRGGERVVEARDEVPRGMGGGAPEGGGVDVVGIGGHGGCCWGGAGHTRPPALARSLGGWELLNPELEQEVEYLPGCCSCSCRREIYTRDERTDRYGTGVVCMMYDVVVVVVCSLSLSLRTTMTHIYGYALPLCTHPPTTTSPSPSATRLPKKQTNNQTNKQTNTRPHSTVQKVEEEVVVVRKPNDAAGKPSPHIPYTAHFP